MNDDLKEYYNNHFNKDGHGAPFEQLTDDQLDAIRETIMFNCFMIAKSVRNFHKVIHVQIFKHGKQQNSR